MKKYCILIISLILVLTLNFSAISIYATDNWIGVDSDLIYGISKQISFTDLGISSEGEKWCDVAANFQAGDMTTDFYIGVEDIGLPYSEVVYMLFDLFEEKDGFDTKFYLYQEDNTMVIDSDIIESGDRYLLKIIDCENHKYFNVNREELYCHFRVCENCGYIDSQEHDFVYYRGEEASCVENTIVEYECSKQGCGYIKSEEAVKVPHTFNDGVVITESTCTEDGIREYTCEECDYSYQVNIEKLGHDYNWLGKCKRVSCSSNYFNLNVDFSGVKGWFNKSEKAVANTINKVKDWFGETTENVVDWSEQTTENVTDWFEKTTEKSEEWVEDIFDKDDSSNSSDTNFIDDLKELLDKLLALIMGAVVGYIVVKCIPIVVAFFKKIFKIKDKRR